jgi:hypothetical protein
MMRPFELTCGTHCPPSHSVETRQRQALVALVQVPSAFPATAEQQGVALGQSVLFWQRTPQEWVPPVPATHAMPLAQQALSQTWTAGQQASAMHCPPSAQQTPLQSASGHVEGVPLLQARPSKVIPRPTTCDRMFGPLVSVRLE